MSISHIRNLLTPSWMIHPEIAAIMHPILRGALSGLQFEKKELGPVSKTTAYAGKDGNISSNNNIAIYTISGVMFKHDSCESYGTRTIARAIAEADAEPSVVGHILIIESGGGASNSVPELADVIDNLNKPIVCLVDGIACSAAQWAAALCDYIIASRPTDQVGCIGTYIEYVGHQRSGSTNADGESVVRIYADGSEEKNEEYEAALAGNFTLVKERLLNPINELFKQDIKARRPMVTDEYLKGRTYNAEDVLGILVDEIGSLDRAIEKCFEMAESNTTTQTEKPMENLNNIRALPGLDNLEVQADGCITLNPEQIATINTALGTDPGENPELTDLRGQVTALTTERDNLRLRVTELEALDEDPAATTSATESDTTLKTEQTEQSPMDAAREHIKMFHS